MWRWMAAWAAVSMTASGATGNVGGPVRFEENRGQTAREVSHLARAAGHLVFVQGASLVFSPASGGAARLSFEGTRAAKWHADGLPADRISYFVGNDPAKWVREAPVYDRLIWRKAYPGIDVVLYGMAGRVEYDLVVSPGADVSAVRVRFAGASKAKLERDGSIVVGGFVQRAPRIYQLNSSGGQEPVDGRFVPAGESVYALRLGAYDRNRTLTVDPVVEALGYIGGERRGRDRFRGRRVCGG